MLPKALPSSRCKRRAGNIMKHPTRPTHRLFYFHTKTTRLRNSYYPQEVSSTLASMMTQQQLTLYVVCSVLFSVHCRFLLLFYLFIFILKHVNHVKTDLSFVCFISFVFLIFFFSLMGAISFDVYQILILSPGATLEVRPLMLILSWPWVLVVVGGGVLCSGDNYHGNITIYVQ